MKTKTNKLRRKQIDRMFNAPINLKEFKTPKSGWIYEIRRCLGMTLTDLAVRLGVIKQRIFRMQADEKLGKVTLETLRRAAEAMDCEFVYAFVPRKSLEEFLDSQAKKTAKDQIKQVSRTMSLESQDIDQSAEKDAIEDLARELVERQDRSIWKLR